jgi:hypothetical protein
MIPGVMHYQHPSDREADEYELSLHRKSAARGFMIGGVLIALAIVIVVVTGIVKIGLLILPGGLAIGNGWTHRDKANALEARLRQS